MAGLFGVGGSAAKTDRKFQLQSWGDLANIFGQQQQQGAQLSQAGGKNLGTGANYWNAILSGDPTKMSAALAPQISAIKGQTGQNIAGLQQFSGRSGGTNAAVQNETVSAQTAIQNLFDLLGPEAAQQLTQIGEFQTSAGLTAEEGAAGTAGELASATGSARPGDQAQQQAQQAAVMEGLTSLFLPGGA
jgi:hypothetical protein